MSLIELTAQVGAISDLLSAAALMSWDMRTMMPAGGAESRGESLATLAQLARALLLSPATQRALEGAETETADLAEDAIERRSVRAVREAISYHEKLPPDLVLRRNRLKAAAQASWVSARAENDFAQFAPYLEETVVLARELADAIGYQEHPHDALLRQFEPDTTGAKLAPISAALRREIGPLLARVLDQPPPMPLPVGPYPIASQQLFGREVALRFGFDFARGRLDPTVHPFETALSRNDVRITARYRTDVLDVGLKATMHETGHGLYEQGVDPQLSRTALAIDLEALSLMGGPSLGVHESQSRLWENHVGRSLPFWRHNYEALQRAFPGVFDDFGLDEFYRGFNAVRPGLIRTEADELSYDFHIMLRTELERALIDGSLSVADLPGAWNEAMARDLGVVVPSDADGVLQDIHWSLGQFGSFCSYTVGNVLAAQIWDSVSAEAEVAQGIAAGDFAPLLQVLTERLYRHGRRYSPAEVATTTSGRPLDPGPYVRYLSNKYSALYGLS